MVDLSDELGVEAAPAPAPEAATAANEVELEAAEVVTGLVQQG